MADAPETKRVTTTSIHTWLSQGEQLYAAALAEFRALESQIDDLEQKLAAKQAEVNQIAQIIGKPGVEGTRRMTGQIIPAPGQDEFQERAHLPSATPPATNSSNATIARALTGRFGR